MEIAVTGVEGMGNIKDKIRSKDIVEFHMDDVEVASINIWKK